MTFQNALRCFIGRALRAHRTGKKAALGLNPAPAPTLLSLVVKADCVSASAAAKHIRAPMDDTLRQARQRLAAMTAAADAMSSPSNRVSVDLGKKMAALNRQADDLLAVKAVTELTSLECERMGIANIQSSSLVAEPKIATPGRTAGRAPAATTAISVNPVGGETSSPFLRSLRSGGSTVASYDDDHRRQEFRDVANTLSSFTASLPVDRPLMSESPDWMARTRSTSFAAAHGPLFKPPVPPPSHAPTFGSPSLKNGELFPAPILMSLPRAASYSATFSSPAAADASANYAVDAAVHYAASLGHAPTAPPHVEAARAALRGCARTPSTSALKIAAEAPASGGEKERLALFDRVQRTSLPTPLPLSETFSEGVVTELTSAEYEAQQRLQARASSDRAATAAEARIAAGVPRSPTPLSRIDTDVGVTYFNGDGPTTSMHASPGPSHGVGASPWAAGRGTPGTHSSHQDYMSQYMQGSPSIGRLETASSAARYAAARSTIDGATLLEGLNGSLDTLVEPPAMPRQPLSEIGRSVCSSDPDGFVHHISSPARVPHIVKKSPMHIEGVPLCLCLKCYDCPCSCVGGGPVARAAALPRLF